MSQCCIFLSDVHTMQPCGSVTENPLQGGAWIIPSWSGCWESIGNHRPSLWFHSKRPSAPSHTQVSSIFSVDSQLCDGDKRQTELTSHLLPACSICLQITSLSSTSWPLQTHKQNQNHFRSTRALLVIAFATFVAVFRAHQRHHAVESRGMNTGTRAGSGWVNCSTELIPLSHTNADRWKSQALVCPVAFWATQSHPAGSQGLTSQWLHTDGGGNVTGWSYYPATWQKYKKTNTYARFAYVFSTQVEHLKGKGRLFSQLYFMPVIGWQSQVVRGLRSAVCFLSSPADDTYMYCTLHSWVAFKIYFWDPKLDEYDHF